ncbi:MAG: hypothetical protein JOY62_04760 [Acidobacteriaceae bacterium]|nr:hypothetical protein [Acidobacteriaceae bacterium]MBV9779266.1 hypothetical protein [Acidobacteriaceae bacterium]
MKSAVFALFSMFAGVAFAQDPAYNLPPTTDTREDTVNNPVTLAQPVEHGSPNYVNFFAFANGVYDSSSPVFQSGQSQSGSPSAAGWGIEAGGGVTAYHDFNHGSLALSYRGAYRDYESSLYPNGTDQSLSFLLRKALNKRWGFTYAQAAGIFLNGGTYYSLQAGSTSSLNLNPYSQSTKFASSSITFSYQQTMRLSYEFGGDFNVNRYGGLGPFGTTGVGGSASMLYRLTRRTTVSGTYSHTYYTYQSNAGITDADNLYLTLSHDFSSRWHGGISAGVSRTDSSGTVETPGLFLINGELLAGYVAGPYKRISTFPFFQGTLSRVWRRSQFTVNAGQDVSSGNGLFLASRNEYANGFYSYGTRKWNIGFGGNYSRLSSVANSAVPYSSRTLSNSVGYSLTRYVGLNLRYFYTDYGHIGLVPGRIDNRVTFGFVFNSKDVPITLF